LKQVENVTRDVIGPGTWAISVQRVIN